MFVAEIRSLSLYALLIQITERETVLHVQGIEIIEFGIGEQSQVLREVDIVCLTGEVLIIGRDRVQVVDVLGEVGRRAPVVARHVGAMEG